MTGTARRVLFISQRFPPEKGGNASRIHDTATQLADRGWSVTVLAPLPCYPPGEFDRRWSRSTTESIDGVTVHRLWTWQPQVEGPGIARRLPYYLLFGLHAMLWLLWNVRRYDVVITSTPPISTGAPGLLATALGKPWTVDVRDLWIDAAVSLGYIEAGGCAERISRGFQRLVLHSADRITVTTPTMVRLLRSTYGDELNEKTVVIPNGVDTERFHPDEGRPPGSGPGTDRRLDAAESGERTGRRARAGTATRIDSATRRDDEPAVVVYAGNLGSAQDLEACVPAIPRLDHDDTVLRLVGSGDIESRLRELADELGVDNRVEFVGTVPRSEVPEILNTATIGIAPLKDAEVFAYAMPTKVYEYMACGLPVLVTGRGEVERFVLDSDGGVHARNDPAAIAHRIDEMLADERRRQRMAERGRDHVVEHYDRDAITRDLETELVNLVNTSPRR